MFLKVQDVNEKSIKHISDNVFYRFFIGNIKKAMYDCKICVI